MNTSTGVFPTDCRRHARKAFKAPWKIFRTVKCPVLQAPLNPADVNQIEGTYPIKPTLPATPGNEGVGIVAEVGSKVMQA